MANIFEFPLVNPLRAIWQNDHLPSNSGTTYLQAFNPAFNYKNIDSDFYLRTLKYYEEKKAYVQPWQQSDTIRIIFLGSGATLGNYQYARLLDSSGNVYAAKSVTVVQEGGPYDGMYLYSITIKLFDLAEGKYFVQTGYNGGSGNQYVIFEPIHVKQIHDRTIRFDYRNSYNDQSIIYPSETFIFQLRVHGFVKLLPPEADFNVYEDQPKNKEMVSGTPSRIYEAQIGIGQGVPDSMADRINRLALCDVLQIDGFDYTRESGAKLEPINSNEGKSLSTYKLKLGERYNTSTIDVPGSTLIIGNMPQTNYFWIEDISIGTTINMRMMFKGKRNFLDYLNSTYLTTSGYWAEDTKSQLVFVPKSGVSLVGTYQLTAANTLSYGIKFVCKGAGDIEIDISGPVSNHYAVVWGDGSANVNKTTLATHPATTTISKTFLTTTEKEMYLFFTNATAIADNATTVKFRSIGGDLPPAMTYFIPLAGNPEVEKFENNVFNYVTAMVDFDIQGYNLDTYAINDLARYIYDTLPLWSTSGNIHLEGQIMVAPPSMSDEGIKFIVSSIINRVTTFATD